MSKITFALIGFPFIAVGLFMIILNSCTGSQGIVDDIEKIADNDGVIIKVEQEAFKEDTNVKINVDIINKDPPVNSIPRFFEPERA